MSYSSWTWSPSPSKMPIFWQSNDKAPQYLQIECSLFSTVVSVGPGRPLYSEIATRTRSRTPSRTNLKALRRRAQNCNDDDCTVILLDLLPRGKYAAQKVWSSSIALYAAASTDWPIMSLYCWGFAKQVAHSTWNAAAKPSHIFKLVSAFSAFLTSLYSL